MAETACVSFSGDLGLYAEGYLEGAEALLEVVKKSGENQDLLVYPIVYSLRHAVELLLKQVIRAARLLVDKPGDFPDSHRIEDLWKTCKPLLKSIWPNDPSFATVESVISRLSELDPEGQAFRYPVGTREKGVRAPTLDIDLRHLDLGALVADVGDVIRLLQGADTGIDVYMDGKRDMLDERRQIEREMRAEYEAEMRGE